VKNRKRENCTSGSVRDEDGNILIYSAKGQEIEETSASFEARSAPRSYRLPLAVIDLSFQNPSYPALRKMELVEFHDQTYFSNISFS
jgi:hypothetical protein